LFLARYIEKFGTGILMMIRESAAHGLPEPQFEQRPGEFVIKLWRDWLTDRVLAELQLKDRQRLAITHLKTHGRITNSDFQKLTGAPHRTAARDLMGLVRLGLLDHKGTGRGAGYVLRLNRAINVPNVPPTQTRREPDKPVTVKGSAKGPQRAQSALTKSATNRPNRPSAETGQKQDKRNTPPKSAGSRRLPKGPKRK